MNTPLAPHYYLDNFRFLIAWVYKGYADLLSQEEHCFIERFTRLNRNSQCLLVRFISRKGPWFRADKLHYVEIENHLQAAAQLIESTWVSVDALMSVVDVANLLTKAELLCIFSADLVTYKTQRKAFLTHILSEIYREPKTWVEWTGSDYGQCYQVNIQPIINTLLLLFFGNPYQNLSEFVLQDLGQLRYENYTIDKHHRIFKSRDDLAQYQQLLVWREQLGDATSLSQLEQLAEQLHGVTTLENPGMERRRARLVNQLAYEFERNNHPTAALQLYQKSHLPPARERRIRLLEKTGEYTQAWQLLSELISNPASEHELQIAERIAPRLAKKIDEAIFKTSGLIPANVKPAKKINALAQTLVLPQLSDDFGSFLRVEEIVRRQLETQEAPCFYVENALLNGLFGLWLWPELYRNIDGAFANPFQLGPLDLYHEDFQKNRPALQQLWQLLDEQDYAAHIHRLWQQKQGIANPFVNWQLINEELLTLALTCIPATHLKLIFQRLLFDLNANRSGLPDLIQFFPGRNQYRMIEVKGPGDRIQDNQQRWLDFFRAQNIPVEVHYVTWQ